MRFRFHWLCAMNLLSMIISAVVWSLLHISTTFGQTTGYCPGGSISYPQQSISPPTEPPLLLSGASGRKPTGAASVLGLTNPIFTAANFNPSAILTSPPQQSKQPSTVLGASRPSAAAANLDLSRPSPPPCNYTCYGDSYCNSPDEKCCINGCQQICRKAVQLTSPPVTCATVKCARGSQCLNLTSGAVCDRPVNNGTCPDPQNFYGGNFAGCASDSACYSNGKCCRSQDSGFVCTPVSRQFPLTCNDVYCAGNKACTINDATGLPQCVPNKRGQCPYYEVLYGPLRSNNGECRKQCSVDIDCRGNLKCCQIGCDQVCVAPDLSYTCQCKQCSGPFRCQEDEYGYGTCVSVTKKPGICSSTPFINDIIPFPCDGNDKPGECGVDGDCRGNQKCCRPDYCRPSMCTPPKTSCDDSVYCHYDEMCQDSTGIAMCAKGLCPPRPPLTPFCPVTSSLASTTCQSNADCGSNPICPNRICCPGVCHEKTCRKSGIYCGYVNGAVQVCPSGNLCLNPLYPVIPDYTCYDPNPGQHQIAGCF